MGKCVLVREKCPQFRGVLIEGFHCTVQGKLTGAHSLWTEHTQATVGLLPLSSCGPQDHPVCVCACVRVCVCVHACV